MKKFLALALVLIGCNTAPTHSEPPIQAEANSCPMPKCPQIEAVFSPNGGATEMIVARIGTANKTIYVQAYSFTSAPIAEALIKAHRRNVRVEVLVDKSQTNARGTVLPMLLGNGISTLVDDKHAIAHNKIIILDGREVITGSFNFTNAAEHNNAENSMFIIDDRVAKGYTNNWFEHRQHSVSPKL